jgi:hypothetical protein
MLILETNSQVYYPVVESRALVASVITQDDNNAPSVDNLLIYHFGPSWRNFKAIAQCESGGKQDINSRVVVSLDGRDFGYLQIRDVHDPEMEKLGLEPRYFLEDNIRAASIIFERQGYAAWENCSLKLNLLPEFSFQHHEQLAGQ